MERLLARLDFEELHDSFIEPFAAIVKADADFFAAVETDDDADVVLPSFPFPAPYTKVTSTGHGDTFMDHGQPSRLPRQGRRAACGHQGAEEEGSKGTRPGVQGRPAAGLPPVHRRRRCLPNEALLLALLDAKELMEIMLAFGKTTCESLDIKVEKLLGPIKFKLLEDRREAQSKKTMEHAAAAGYARPQPRADYARSKKSMVRSMSRNAAQRSVWGGKVVPRVDEQSEEERALFLAEHA